MTSRNGRTPSGAVENAAGAPAFKIMNEFHFEKYATVHRELGHHAVWTVSSAKYGNGVHQLRDGSADTFWQSDGVLPHFVRVEFAGLVPIHAVAISLSYANDESYTPTKLSIRAGTHEGDIVEVAALEVDRPNGWILAMLVDDSIDVPQPVHGSSVSAVAAAPPSGAVHPVYATVLTLVIAENHQQGRDTHVRGVRIFAPPQPQQQTQSCLQPPPLR